MAAPSRAARRSADSHNFLYGGGGDDTVFGGEGDDHLYGEAGKDRLTGGEGNDRLNGGSGNDILTGGEGSDHFVFNRGLDRITDFENGDDVINLSSFAQFDSFADIRAAAKQVGTDVVIKAGADALTIEDFRLTQMDGGDFIW